MTVADGSPVGRADDEGRADAGDVSLWWERYGPADGTPLLLVAGLGGQLLNWEPEFCRLLTADGHRVICFDNRDVGLSTHLDEVGPADPLRALQHGDAPYVVADMAADAAGLLDALGLDSAHVVGVSMGGMIAQELALAEPGRVRSLVSIMSSTGAGDVGQPSPEAQALLLKGPTSDRAASIAAGLEGARLIASAGFDFDEELVARRVAGSYDRAFDPKGAGRQLAAILASRDRTQRLRGLAVPTLVVHGDADPLVDVSGGVATAAAVPGARLELIAGMGHDLPRGAWGRLVDLILDHVRSVEQAHGAGRGAA